MVATETEVETDVEAAAEEAGTLDVLDLMTTVDVTRDEVDAALEATKLDAGLLLEDTTGAAELSATVLEDDKLVKAAEMLALEDDVLAATALVPGECQHACAFSTGLKHTYWYLEHIDSSTGSETCRSIHRRRLCLPCSQCRRLRYVSISEYSQTTLMLIHCP